MDADQIKGCSDLLIHESEQLHENIQRTLANMQLSSAVTFPALTSLFAIFLERKVGSSVDVNVLFALFAIAAGLLATTFNSSWMQLIALMRFKYAEVMPRLYALNLRSGSNFGQYTARGGVLKAMAGVIIVQAILVPTTIGATWYARGDNALSAAANVSSALAVITTLISWPLAAAGFRAVRASEEEKGPGPSASP